MPGRNKKMLLLYFIRPLINLTIFAVLGELVTLGPCFLRFPCPKSIFIYLSFLFVKLSDLYCFAGNDVQHYDEMESCCKSLIVHVKKWEMTKYGSPLVLEFVFLSSGSFSRNSKARLFAGAVVVRGDL